MTEPPEVTGCTHYSNELLQPTECTVRMLESIFGIKPFSSHAWTHTGEGRVSEILCIHQGFIIIILGRTSGQTSKTIVIHLADWRSFVLVFLGLPVQYNSWKQPVEVQCRGLFQVSSSGVFHHTRCWHLLVQFWLCKSDSAEDCLNVMSLTLQLPWEFLSLLLLLSQIQTL